jgi:hypothetical protein
VSARLAELFTIARTLRCYSVRHQADPHLACIAVLTPYGLQGLLLGLDVDVVNARPDRLLDPRIIVFHREKENTTLYVARSYPSSACALHSLDAKTLSRLRDEARISHPDARSRHVALRHGV